MSNQPIVILGMHRSGTTMVTKLLENLGLFVGAEKEPNNEAMFFWEINNWIFDLHTATAEKPYNMQFTNPACRKVIEESLHYYVQSRRKKKFLGALNNKFSSIAELDIPWGWKDPKNTFTLDFWKSVFPNPKIIHIYRNPVDSIASYTERDLELKNKFEWNWKKKLKRDLLVSKNFHENFRIYDFEQGYLVWKAYVEKASSLKYDNTDFIEIKYEDFLAEPEIYLAQLLEFCGLSPDENAINTQIEQLKKDRAYAFTQNEKLYTFYQQIKEDSIVKQLGYSDL